MHAQRGQEIAGDFGIGAVLRVVNLAAIAAERDVVFNFTGGGAGVAADAALNVESELSARVCCSRRGH